MLLYYELLILGNNRKIPLDCSKFHMTYEVTVLLLWMQVVLAQIKALFVQRTVGIVLA